MALQYLQSQQRQKKGNSFLGTLGTLATLGGMATGIPWLSALGTFSSGADALINGGSGGNSASVAKQTGGALGNVLSGLKDIWPSITDNNIAKTEEQQATDKMQRIAEKTGASTANPEWDWSPFSSAGSSWITGGPRWRNGQYVIY